jgi:hypothetical protein
MVLLLQALDILEKTLDAVMRRLQLQGKNCKNTEGMKSITRVSFMNFMMLQKQMGFWSCRKVLSPALWYQMCLKSCATRG